MYTSIILVDFGAKMTNIARTYDKNDPVGRWDDVGTGRDL